MTDEGKTESSSQESPKEMRRRLRREARLRARQGGESALADAPKSETTEQIVSPREVSPIEEADSELIEDTEPEPAEEAEPEPVEKALPEPVEDTEPQAVEPLPVRPRRRRRGRLTCLFGMFLGLAGLVAGRLGVLWIHFDVFSQFTLHFVVMTIAFLAGYLMPRARVLTAIALMILAVVAIGVWPQIASRNVEVVGAASGAERTLRLMSFNTRLAANNGDAVADEVLRNDPDVAVLVEFGEHKRAALEKLKSRYPYQADCLGVPECYLVIIAKVPFANVQSRTGWEGPPLMRVSFGSELAGVTVVGVHTIRFPHQRAQLRQIEELTHLLDDLQGPRIVAGDFNATPFSRLLGTFAERSRMTRFTILPTWPSWLRLPQLAIDHVFGGRGIRVIESPRIGRNVGSDHYPVIVGLAISPS